MAKILKKVRPDKDGIQACIDSVQQGRLDGRTRQAQMLSRTQEALQTDPEATIKALLRHTIASNAMLQNEILRNLQGQELLDDTGRLPELISKDLLKIQRCLNQSAALLGQIEGCFPTRGKTKPQKEDSTAVATIILGDEQEED